MQGIATLGGAGTIKNALPSQRSDAMNTFIQRHRKAVTGVISGWDRLLFRGTMRLLSYVDGLRMGLNLVNVRLDNFKTYVQAMTEGI
jgi:hypothetical protein